MDNNLVCITGATGMAGSALIDYILENTSDNILAFKRRRSRLDNINHLIDNPRIIWETVEITDPNNIDSVISHYLPYKLFHLGAMSYVPNSWKAPLETIDVNIKGPINIFEAVRKNCPDCVVHVAGSSEAYGLVYPHEVPIKETNPLRPLSPYGCSKVALEHLAFTYFRSYKLKTVITRGFNHTGINRGEEFVTAQVCKQAAEIILGRRSCFYLGNLEAQRDFTDVRDMVRGYWLATDRCNYGEPYNICSGKAYSVKDVVNMVSRIAGITSEVKQDRNRMRPADVPVLLGDNSKFREATGWEPGFDFERETLSGMFDAWCERISGKPAVQVLI